MKAGPSKEIKVGPWGGQGGAPWDDGSYGGLRSVTLLYDRCIDSIRFEYDKNGKSVMGERHGGSGGSRSIQIRCAWPEEYLTDITGYIAPAVQGGSPVIRSLKFKTNKKSFGPYGTEEGAPFALPMEEGMVVGFHGRSGQYLDSIGMYLSRIHARNIYGSVHQKIQKKLGDVACKKLGNKDGGHCCPAGAKTNKAVA